jgi:tetratricopeptide (TPR) repeat protein
LSLARDLNDPASLIDLHDKLGYLYLKQQNWSQSIDQYLRARTTAAEIQNFEAASKALNNLGSIYLTLEQHSTAIDYFYKALSIRQQIGDKPGQTKLWFILGKVFKEQNQIQESIAAFRSAQKLFEEMGQHDLVEPCNAVLDSLTTR